MQDPAHGGRLRDPGGRPAGTHEATELTVANDRLIPAVYVLEAGSPGSVIAPAMVTLPHGARATARYTVHAPATAGRYNRFHTVHWYPLLLPVAVVLWLHALAPAAAMLGARLGAAEAFVATAGAPIATAPALAGRWHRLHRPAATSPDRTCCR